MLHPALHNMLDLLFYSFKTKLVKVQSVNVTIKCISMYMQSGMPGLDLDIQNWLCSGGEANCLWRIS